MRESKVEKHLIKRVKELGGEVRKLQWIGRSHAPDRLLLLPRADSIRYATGLHINDMQANHPLVELKAPGIKPNEGQLREHERLRNAGFIVLVLDTIEKIDEVLGV